MTMNVETSTPPGTPTPIGPYNHIAKVGPFITIGGTAGVDPATGRLAGPDVHAQTTQILKSFAVMLASVGSDLGHVLHINVFLAAMSDFERMNAAYIEAMGAHRREEDVDMQDMAEVRADRRQHHREGFEDLRRLRMDIRTRESSRRRIDAGRAADGDEGADLGDVIVGPDRRRRAGRGRGFHVHRHDGLPCGAVRGGRPA